MKKSTIKVAEDTFLPTLDQANRKMDVGNYSHLDEFVATFQAKGGNGATSIFQFREDLEEVVKEAFLQGAKEEEIKCSNKLAYVNDSDIYLTKWKSLSKDTAYQVMTGEQIKKHSMALIGWCEIPESLINFK